jgi:hypothetical protein
MKPLAALLLVLVSFSALAQPGPGWSRGQPGRNMQRESGRPMPPPERRMDWEARQQMREQVRDGEMTRDDARQRWREQRRVGPGRSPEERQKMRRDVQEANRDLERR